jgi:hypothetical protein
VTKPEDLIEAHENSAAALIAAQHDRRAQDFEREVAEVMREENPDNTEEHNA